MNNLINSQITIAHVALLVGVGAVLWILVSSIKAFRSLKADIKSLKEKDDSVSQQGFETWQKQIAMNTKDCVSKNEFLKLSDSNNRLQERISDDLDKKMRELEKIIADWKPKATETNISDLILKTLTNVFSEGDSLSISDIQSKINTIEDCNSFKAIEATCNSLAGDFLICKYDNNTFRKVSDTKIEKAILKALPTDQGEPLYLMDGLEIDSVPVYLEVQKLFAQLNGRNIFDLIANATGPVKLKDRINKAVLNLSKTNQIKCAEDRNPSNPKRWYIPKHDLIREYILNELKMEKPETALGITTLLGRIIGKVSCTIQDIEEATKCLIPNTLKKTNNSLGATGYKLVYPLMHHPVAAYEYVSVPQPVVVPNISSANNTKLENILFNVIKQRCSVAHRLSTKRLSELVGENCNLIQPILKEMAKVGRITQKLDDHKYWWGLPEKKKEDEKNKVASVEASLPKELKPVVSISKTTASLPSKSPSFFLHEPVEKDERLHVELLACLKNKSLTTNELLSRMGEKFLVVKQVPQGTGTYTLKLDKCDIETALHFLEAASKVRRDWGNEKEWKWLSSTLVRLHKTPSLKEVTAKSIDNKVEETIAPQIDLPEGRTEIVEKIILKDAASWVRVASLRMNPSYVSSKNFDKLIMGMIYEGKLFAEYRENPIEVGFSIEDRSLWIKASNKVEPKPLDYLAHVPAKRHYELTKEPVSVNDLFQKYKENLARATSLTGFSPDFKFMEKIEKTAWPHDTLSTEQINQLRGSLARYTPPAIGAINDNAMSGFWSDIKKACEKLATA